jgi:hypothetical protein
MKTTFLTCLLACLLGGTFAQNCDIAHTGIALFNEINTAPIASVATGQRANFKFSIANFGSDVNCSIPAYSVSAVFELPAGGKAYRYDGPETFTSGFFTWKYVAADNVLKGTNILPIPNGKGDADVLVKVKGIASGAASSRLFLTQKNGISDNWANDLSATLLKVTGDKLPPVSLSSFTVSDDKCNAVLNWTTGSEEPEFSHFDVEYSADGATFIKLGTVKAKNQSAGASYTYSYFQLTGNGYYRLKQASKDGKFEYSKTERTTTACTEKGKVLVYPNPILYTQKLIVNISGYGEKINGELFDASGQSVKSYVLSNGKNELSILNLSQGSYMLYVKSNGNTESFKLVITR